MQLMLRRLWIQITADRKRFGLLCVMVAVGLLLWGRIIVTSDLPRTAVADDPGGPPGGKAGAVGAAAERRRLPPIRVALAGTPDRDPLIISDEHFPRPTSIESLGQDDPKSGRNAADDAQQADRRRTEVLWTLVSRFRLEGVMQGRPMAVINGKTHRLFGWVQAIGDQETYFQLIEVGHRSVVLECEGRRFRLNMDSGIEER